MKAENRKKRPVYSGFMSYFPKTIKEVSHISFLGNEQHHPGKPLHWDKSKSMDHMDCLGRHMLDHSIEPIDDDEALHLFKVAWRAMAAAEIYLDNHPEYYDKL